MHTHIIGASGTGKSTLFYNLIRQDIENGEGVSVIDPHGDLVDRLLAVIPDDRIADVVLLDPADDEHVVGFNILSAHTDWENNLLASDLVSVFRRLSTAWGDQMNSVIRNAILAFLKSDRGGTLVELRRFLLEPAFRNEYLKSVTDENVVYYWQKAFPQLAGNKSVGSVVTRLDSFLSPESLRFMVGQKENRVDFADIMDSGKIFLAKLSQGLIGEDNAHLLGSLIVAKIQSTAMSRQRQSEENRRSHFLYADEFQDVLTESIAKSLTGVRKYRLGLTLGHQEMWQVEREPHVARALLSNTYTRIVFRVGDKDARTLEDGLSSFAAADLQNLGRGEAICRVERNDCDFNLDVDAPDFPDDAQAALRRKDVVEASRKAYSTPRQDIEAALSRAEPVRKPESDAPPTKKRVDEEEESSDSTIVPHHTEEPVSLAPASEPEPIRQIEPALRAPQRPVPAAIAGQTTPSVSSAPPPELQVRPEAAEPTDLGRGGAQHKAIQKRLKEAGEDLGFRCEIEKTILDGTGSIDIALHRGEVAIACEITVTNTIDYEVGNVAKCLKARWAQVAVVGVSAIKLGQLKEAVMNSLGADVAKRVRFYLPDDFIDYLKGLPLPAPPAPEIKTTRGYKVKMTFPKLTPAEAKAREDAAIKLMTAMMTQPRKQNRG